MIELHLHEWAGWNLEIFEIFPSIGNPPGERTLHSCRDLGTVRGGSVGDEVRIGTEFGLKRTAPTASAAGFGDLGLVGAGFLAWLNGAELRE